MCLRACWACMLAIQHNSRYGLRLWEQQQWCQLPFCIEIPIRASSSNQHKLPFGHSCTDFLLASRCLLQELHTRLTQYSLPTRQQCVCCCVSLPYRDIWAIWGLRFVPDQTPEIMSVSQVLDKGYASCTGLSIFLVNACRAVGIPARIAGMQGSRWFEKSTTA